VSCKTVPFDGQDEQYESIPGWDNHNLIERTAAAGNESEEETDQIVGGTNVPSKGVYPFMV